MKYVIPKKYNDCVVLRGKILDKENEILNISIV